MVETTTGRCQAMGGQLISTCTAPPHDGPHDGPLLDIRVLANLGEFSPPRPLVHHLRQTEAQRRRDELVRRHGQTLARLLLPGV